jgi:uncharacterized coiled-coil protein SlyX
VSTPEHTNEELEHMVAQLREEVARLKDEIRGFVERITKSHPTICRIFQLSPESLCPRAGTLLS